MICNEKWTEHGVKHRGIDTRGDTPAILGQTEENLRLFSRYHGRDSNRTLPDHKSRALSLPLWSYINGRSYDAELLRNKMKFMEKLHTIWDKEN